MTLFHVQMLTVGHDSTPRCICMLCMTLLRVLIASVGHDSQSVCLCACVCLCVCVCVCVRARVRVRVWMMYCSIDVHTYIGTVNLLYVTLVFGVRSELLYAHIVGCTAFTGVVTWPSAPQLTSCN